MLSLIGMIVSVAAIVYICAWVKLEILDKYGK